MIKKLIKLTLHWQPRWLMHVLGTVIICTPLNILLNFADMGSGEILIRSILSATLIYWLADIWETKQMEHFNAKYSFADVYLSVGVAVIYSIFFTFI
jgi:hypothetical protein